MFATLHTNGSVPTGILPFSFLQKPSYDCRNPNEEALVGNDASLSLKNYM